MSASSSPSSPTAVSAASIPAGRAPRPKAAFILDPETHPLVYGPAEMDGLGELVDLASVIIPRHGWREHPEILADMEVLLSGWNAPTLDPEFLRHAPRLRAVFYAAGSVRYFVTEAMWERGIVVSSAAAANAVPVMEYTVGTVLLSLRHFWRKAAECRAGAGWGDHTRAIPGSFRATVGLLSFGAIAREVARKLQNFDLRIVVACPFLTPAEAAAARVERVSVGELFAASDVVSVHTPLLPETEGMVDGRLVSLMKPGATLINTSRGRIIREAELVEVLRRRPDLHAVLDVTDPEPPRPEGGLLALPNVTVTSHIAGSHGRDCQRLGSHMVDELRRFLARRPLLHEVTRADLARRA